MCGGSAPAPQPAAPTPPQTVPTVTMQEGPPAAAGATNRAAGPADTTQGTGTGTTTSTTAKQLLGA